MKSQHTKNKMILSNLYAESQCGLPEEDLPNDLKVKMAILCQRFVWFAEEGDLLVLPYPISKEFKKYAFEILGVDPDQIKEVYLTKEKKDIRLFNMQVLEDSNFIASLKEIIKDHNKWDMLAYYNDRFSAHLWEILTGSINSLNEKFFYSGGAEVLNSKIEFRRLAAAADIPIAPGDYCLNKQEFKKAIIKYIKETGKIIIKQDLNASCEGNIIVNLGEKKAQNCKGAIQTLNLNNISEIDSIVDSLWNRLVRSRNCGLVVETYYETKAVLYSEVEIKSDSPRTRVLNFGDMRMTPTWAGFEIPGNSFNYSIISQFIESSSHLGQVCKNRGYLGKINCDAVITSEGELFFTEINGRLGGCSHIHHVMSRLIGENYLDTTFLLTNCEVKFKGTFSKLLLKLKQEQLLYDQTSAQGIIILEENIESSECFEYLVVAINYEQAAYIENKLLAICKKSYNLG